MDGKQLMNQSFFPGKSFTKLASTQSLIYRNIQTYQTYAYIGIYTRLVGIFKFSAIRNRKFESGNKLIESIFDAKKA